jgi:DNA segregation ATPase FtsK/SpoIIIE, S-DNA-T family
MKLTREKLHDIFGVIFIAIGLLILFGLISKDSLGKFSGMVQFLYSLTFGDKVSFLIPVFLFVEGYHFIKMELPFRHAKNFIAFIVLASTASAAIGVWNYGTDSEFFSASQYEYGDILGLLGFIFSRKMIEYLGYSGSIIALLALFFIIVLFISNFRLTQLVRFIIYPFDKTFRFLYWIYNSVRKYFAKRKLEKEMRLKEEEASKAAEEKSEETEIIPAQVIPASAEKKDHGNNFKIEEAVIERSVEYKAKIDKKYKYVPPDIELLNESKSNANIIEDTQILRDTGVKLEEKLREFSLEAKVVKINPGPVITQYEIELAKGVKVSRVTSLEDDLAMALKAKSIRIVAPIPGKGTIGVEIPNSNPSVVYLKSIISSEKFAKHKSKLAIALGKMINGENYILDLAKTPHLLIAGSTGSGKSVCINGLIVSILYRATPEEVQFCMIDPKKVELSVYSGLLKHHLLQIDGIDDAVVTSPEDAVRLLEALVTEMEKRYDLLNQSGTRNIEEYNTLIESGELKLNEFTSEPFKKLPYIVCIMDEYGDLMMTSGKAVEDPICRLAQMARAIGIHLVLATQRPSVKVVTGSIKANFPTRIAFRVISQVDSRTILDCKGAESLLGKGDMLLIPPGESDLVRIQNALVETKEINKVVDHISKQPHDFDKISIKAKPSSAMIAAMGGDEDEFGGSASEDPKYAEAKRMVIKTGMASVSMLQRGLSVGYARAGKLIDQLERDGVVGPHQGSKSRDVLISSTDDD